MDLYSHQIIYKNLLRNLFGLFLKTNFDEDDTKKQIEQFEWLES